MEGEGSRNFAQAAPTNREFVYSKTGAALAPLSVIEKSDGPLPADLKESGTGAFRTEAMDW
jgi:hypothetical protein